MKRKKRSTTFLHISHNIAKFAIFKKYNIMPDGFKGDLVMLNKQIEVKGSCQMAHYHSDPNLGITYIL